MARYWFTLFWSTALFAPPIAVPFTETRSVFSLAIFVGLAYIAVFLAKNLYTGKVVLPHGRLLAHALAYTVIFYLLIHGFIWFAILGNITVLFTEWQWVFYFLVTFLLISEMRRGGDVLIYFKQLFIWSLTLEALLGIFTSLGGPLPFYDYAVGYYSGRFSQGFYRALSTQTSANVLSGLLAFGALLAIINPRVFSSPVRFLQVAILLLGLLATQSKSGILAFVLGLLITQFLRAMVERQFTYKGVFNMLLLGFAVVFMSFYAENFWQLYSEDYVDRVHTTSLTLQKYVSEYSPAEQIFGVGFRQSAFVSENNKAWSTAHNSYISLLAEIGLIGLFLVVAIILWGAYLLAVHRHWDFLAGSLALAAHFMTEGFVYGHVYVILLACLLVLPAFINHQESLQNSRSEQELPPDWLNRQTRNFRA